MQTMKYKVGDKVLLGAEISKVDTKPYVLPYNVRFPNGTTMWVKENEILSKTYEDGRNDAWELARKIALSTDMVETARIFIASNICGIEQKKLFEDVFALTPQEALAKIEAYEKSQQIQVGDVVYTDDEPDSFGVVTWVANGAMYVLWDDGSNCWEGDLSDFHKTGRTVDIEHLLEQIRGNE